MQNENLSGEQGDAESASPQLELSAVANERVDENPEPAAVAMNAVRRIVRALHSARRATKATLGVSNAQLFVLREIEKAGTPTTKELAGRTATAQSSVSEVVARLISRGFVTRNRSTTDRRRSSIALSPAGVELLSKASETVQERLITAFRQMPADRQSRIADGLSDWISASGLDTVSATMFFEPPFDPLTD